MWNYTLDQMELAMQYATVIAKMHLLLKEQDCSFGSAGADQYDVLSAERRKLSATMDETMPPSMREALTDAVLFHTGKIIAIAGK